MSLRLLAESHWISLLHCNNSLPSDPDAPDSGGWTGRALGTNNLNRAVSHLEKLIGGSVELTRGRERVPVLSYQQGSKSIPVQRASAMVAELAPLLSWMAHLLRPGDLLLIDEPEAHMHPAAVLAVAETLVAISQAGRPSTVHNAQFGVSSHGLQLHATRNRFASRHSDIW